MSGQGGLLIKGERASSRKRQRCGFMLTSACADSSARRAGHDHRQQRRTGSWLLVCGVYVSPTSRPRMSAGSGLRSRLLRRPRTIVMLASRYARLRSTGARLRSTTCLLRRGRMDRLRVVVRTIVIEAFTFHEAVAHMAAGRARRVNCAETTTQHVRICNSPSTVG